MQVFSRHSRDSKLRVWSSSVSITGAFSVMQTGRCARDALALIHIFRSFPGDVLATLIILNKMMFDMRSFIQEKVRVRKKEENVCTHGHSTNVP